MQNKLKLVFWIFLFSSPLQSQKLVQASELTSISQLEKGLATSEGTEKAAIHDRLGTIYHQTGNLQKAIEQWEAALALYGDGGAGKQKAATLILLGKAYTHLGQTLLAIPLLEEALENAPQASDLEQDAWTALGSAHARTGKTEQAIAAYQNSLAIAQSLPTLNNLVQALKTNAQQNLVRAEGALEARKPDEAAELQKQAQRERQLAFSLADRAVALSQEEGDSSSVVYALLNWAELNPDGLSAAQQQQGLRIIKGLPNSRTKAYLLLDWAKLNRDDHQRLLSEAVKVSQSIDDRRALSFALLELGRVYKRSGELHEALTITQEASMTAQADLAYDSLYRAQWLAGRIYRALGQQEGAVEAYRGAVASLQTIRKDLLSAAQEFRLDFQQEVEPVYKEYLELLLSAPAKEESLKEALSVFDSLRLAQLQNFFGDDCELIKSEQSLEETLASTNAALITSIILPKNTYLIVQLPNGTVKKHRISVGEEELNQQLVEWHSLLINEGTDQYLSLSQSLYDLMIRPLEKELKSVRPSALIFIHDGVLRNVPMAALHDGEQFLIEKYPLGISLGFDLSVKPNDAQALEVAAFGLSASVEGWSALPNVEQELEIIESLLGGEQFLNAEFTKQQFEEQVSQGYPVVHLATHGYFGGSAESSFILAYDQALALPELESILSKSEVPIELLVLSACETAAGNERSVLGLAGIAIRSGIKSTLGSLWEIPDDSQVELVKDFYRLQKTDLTKAQALQQAQQRQIARVASHPRSWAALSLIGDWE